MLNMTILTLRISDYYKVDFLNLFYWFIDGISIQFIVAMCERVSIKGTSTIEKTSSL